MAERGRVRDGHTSDAVRGFRGLDRRSSADGSRNGRTGGSPAPRAGGRSEGRDVHGAPCGPRGRALARALRRRRLTEAAMDLARLERKGDTEWWIPQHGRMRVPGVIYGSEPLVREMDEKVFEQVANVASLPGIQRASYAMPDAHWGYGFPIGGVAAFDAGTGGVVSAGGVGFDISCGVRAIRTGLAAAHIEARKAVVAHELSRAIPAGMGR